MPEHQDKQQLSDAQEIAAMTQMRGWGLVFDALQAKILDLQNIANIDTSSADNMVADIKARRMAVDILWAWLKADVFGAIEQQKASHASLVEKGNDFIDRG